MNCRLVRLVIVVAGASLLASPAHAADEIGLSNDGVSWTSSLQQPLFDPAFRWVPGDSETASFYVRNQGPSSALLTIEARSADTDELLSTDDIVLRVRAADGRWVAIENGVASHSLTSESIRRGDVVEVEVNATFDPASTNQSQSKRLALAFEVTLTDARAGGVGDGADQGSGGPDGRDGGAGDLAAVIPDIGSAMSRMLLLIGAMLVGTGLAVVARRDPRAKEAPHG